MRRWFAMAAFLAGTITAWADTPTEKQANVMKHTANAYALADRCPSMQVDTAMAAGMMLFHDMPANSYNPGGPFEDAMYRSLIRAYGEMGNMTEDVACAAAMLMFGPNGGNVPNLMRRR